MTFILYKCFGDTGTQELIVYAYDIAGNERVIAYDIVLGDTEGLYDEGSLSGGGVSSTFTDPVNVIVEPNFCDPDTYTKDGILSAQCCSRNIHEYMQYGTGDYCTTLDESACTIDDECSWTAGAAEGCVDYPNELSFNLVLEDCSAQTQNTCHVEDGCLWQGGFCHGEEGTGNVCDTNGDGVYDESCFLRNRPWPVPNPAPVVADPSSTYEPEIAGFCCGDDPHERTEESVDGEWSFKPNVAFRFCGDVDADTTIAWGSENKEHRINPKEESPCYDNRATLISNLEDTACCADAGACVFNGQCYYDDLDVTSAELDLNNYNGEDYFSDKSYADGSAHGWAKMTCSRVENYRPVKSRSLNDGVASFDEFFPSGITRGVWCPLGYQYNVQSGLCEFLPFACDVGYDGGPTHDVEGFTSTRDSEDQLLCDVNFRNVKQPLEIREDTSTQIRRNYRGEPIDMTGGISYYGQSASEQLESNVNSNGLSPNRRWDPFAKPSQGNPTTTQRNMREDDDYELSQSMNSALNNGCWGIDDASSPPTGNAFQMTSRNQPTTACCPFVAHSSSGPEGQVLFKYTQPDSGSITEIPLN